MDARVQWVALIVKDEAEYPRGVSALFSDPDGNFFSINKLYQGDT